MLFLHLVLDWGWTGFERADKAAVIGSLYGVIGLYILRGLVLRKDLDLKNFKRPEEWQFDFHI